MPKLIGIHGPLNGGKDTAANYLQAKFPDKFSRWAMAGPLKQACLVMFDFSKEQMEDRVLKEQVDPRWGFSPRKAMQLLGTEYGRQMLREDVWIKRAELAHYKHLSAQRGTIITDVRFENEATWLRSQPDSLLIYLEVPGLEKDERYSHSSEAGIVRTESDLHVINDKSKGLSNLFAQLDVVQL